MTPRDSLVIFCRPSVVSRFLLVAFLVLQAQCLLVPDRADRPQPAHNERPTVRITAGAASSDTSGVDYRVDFEWVGNDADGQVRSFRMATDDTLSDAAFTDTTARAVRLRFSAALPASRTGGPCCSEWHTFYVWAVDNEFALSEPDKRYFNARTIAPRSRIIDANGYGTCVPGFISWEGEDLDSSEPGQGPTFYEYKLVELPVATSSDDDMRRWIQERRNLMLDSTEVSPRWVRVPGSVRRAALPDRLDRSGSFYAFAVRAIDEAGAVEPDLIRGGNYIVLGGIGDVPQFSFYADNLGAVTFPHGPDGMTWDLEVPADRPLTLHWSALGCLFDPDSTEWNYAVDIPDPADESLLSPDGIGGWIGWASRSGNERPFVFGAEDGVVHVLHVLFREKGARAGSVRHFVIRMRVTAFRFEKNALLVDDARWQGASGPSDSGHDAFVRTMVARLRDFGPVDSVSVYTDRAEGGQGTSPEPTAIPLSVLARYRHVIWSYQLSSGQSGLRQTESRDGHLSMFVLSGGRLFLFGGTLAGAEKGIFRYPFEPPRPEDIEARSNLFYFNFLFIRNRVVSQRVGDPCEARLSGMVAARSLNPAYPDLELDPAKRDPYYSAFGEYLGGIDTWEGVQRQPNEILEAVPGLDSLYAVETWNRSLNANCASAPSAVDGSICAMRYEAPEPEPATGASRGRLVYFNFQPFYFQADPVKDAGTAAINWLVTGRDY